LNLIVFEQMIIELLLGLIAETSSIPQTPSSLLATLSELVFR
jgi:hypothetical protein